MSEESVRTEGASPARAGESARQLIRRAKQASRRKFPAEEKIRILLEGIHPTIYYKLTALLVGGTVKVLTGGGGECQVDPNVTINAATQNICLP